MQMQGTSPIRFNRAFRGHSVSPTFFPTNDYRLSSPPAKLKLQLMRIEPERMATPSKPTPQYVDKVLVIEENYDESQNIRLPSINGSVEDLK